MILEAAFSWEANLSKGSNVDMNLDSSCAIRAERRLGRLPWAAQSMVLTFQHATFSIFALLEMGAYFPYFNILGPLEKIPVDRGKPTGGWETSFD